MKRILTYDCGPVILAPDVYEDNRGYFYESFNEKEFNKELGLKVKFVQDNQSLSTYGVVRGLHYQKPPFAQSKLVRVIKGKVLDIAVDMRIDSPTFRQYCTALLTEENKHMFYIPKGFAHGFVSLSLETIFQYKCDNYYNKDSEGGILWNTKGLKAAAGCVELWNVEQNMPKVLKISDKDNLLHDIFSLSTDDFFTTEEWKR